MFPFKATLTTSNVSKGTNTRKYIVLHHTGTKEGTIRGVLNTLTKGKVSCHFVIDTNGDAYKIGDPSQILWHAGVSEWQGIKNLNAHSVGIEIIGPLSDGGFTQAQKIMVKRLVGHLMWALNLTSDKVIRHKDIAPGRKTDPADTLWNKEYATYQDYQKSFVAKEAK